MGVPPKGTPKYKRWLKPKKTNKNFGKTKKCLKVSDAPLDMGLVLFGFGFTDVFQTKKKEKETKNISKGGSEIFKNFVLCFPENCFGFLWFSFVCLVSSKVLLVF